MDLHSEAVEEVAKKLGWGAIDVIVSLDRCLPINFTKVLTLCVYQAEELLRIRKAAEEFRAKTMEILAECDKYIVLQSVRTGTQYQGPNILEVDAKLRAALERKS
jgi:hypothetical protein